MKHVLKKSRIQYLVDNRNGYLVLASGSLLLNIVLGVIIYCVLGYEKTVLVPPTIIHGSWVSENKVSSNYLSSMSILLADIRLNLTPANAALQRQLFLEYVDPKNYEKLKTELIEEEEKLKNEHISMTFFMTNVGSDADKMVSKIEGDLQYIVGDSLQPSKHVVYKISYRLSSGRLMIQSLEEVKDHV